MNSMPSSRVFLIHAAVELVLNAACKESELPLAIQAKVFRHISFHEVYSLGKAPKSVSVRLSRPVDHAFRA